MTDIHDLYYLGLKGLICNDDGKYLILRVNVSTFTGYDGPAYRDLPGGRIMRGESIQHALHREIEEETGLSDVVVDTKYLMTVSPLRIPNTDQSSKSSFGLVLSVYHCKLNGVADITLSDEHQGYDWVDSDKLVDRLKVKYNTNFLEQLINQIAN